MLNNLIKKLKKEDRKVAGGMLFFSSPGHMLGEADLLLRYVLIGKASKSTIVILPPTDMCIFTGKVLTHLGVEVLYHPDAYKIIAQISIFFPELIIDIGFATSKLNNNKEKSRIAAEHWNNEVFYNLTANEYYTSVIEYFAVWNVTKGYYPFRIALDTFQKPDEVQNIISRGKYVMLKIESFIRNATGKLIDPSSYVRTIIKLKELGYNIVLAGREHMPIEFNKLGIYDYANSKFASALNDAMLFRYCEFAISTGSGATLFAEVLGIKSCSLGTFQMIPYPSGNNLTVPTRLKIRSNNKVLIFSEHMIFLYSNYHPITGISRLPLNENGIELLEPNELDIYDTVVDLLYNRRLSQESDLRLKNLDKTGVYLCNLGSLAPSFLFNHLDYFN